MRKLTIGKDSMSVDFNEEFPANIEPTIKCLSEIWHVQTTLHGSFVGYYQFFHPNPEAARMEAENLRRTLSEQDGWKIYVGRYTLTSVEE